MNCCGHDCKRWSSRCFIIAPQRAGWLATATPASLEFRRDDISSAPMSPWSMIGILPFVATSVSSET
jgi:hypothetical protein